MSHIAKIEVQIKSLEALKAACKQLGLVFHEGQTTYKWFGEYVEGYNPTEGYDYEQDSSTFGTSLHAISLADNEYAYEVGVIQSPDGQSGFRLVYDPFLGGKGLEAVIGKGACKLKQAYGVQVATQQARRQGFRVQQQATQDGKVRLVCTR